ncbi:hypothetical protein [Helicobacter sp.]|uniref:hypothetical protein n=1 Tax=Helicobacter sp. TaxID=218 RepID=UPI0025C6F521|nr:hypothetical protein [Helicobacter sp.]MBR2494099.1 hypothetical protein [Helicobacter sp.]
MISLCLLALLLAFFGKLRYGAVLSVVIVAACNVKILGYSACEYYVACFDTPSVLSLALSVCYLARILLKRCTKDRYKALLEARIMPLPTLMLWGGFGLWLYLGVLGIGLVDIYHIDSRVQITIIAGFIIACGLYSMTFALLACVSLAVGSLADFGLYESVIDVGLWLVCVGLGLWSAYQKWDSKRHLPLRYFPPYLRNFSTSHTRDSKI